ncbi:Uncharacterized protein dnm_055010 [Desulfonema magnum]|uniref:Uncharacterized protein n=1 Tax=Desulfonema magnum TaxID=45655 RepID=A0A975BQ64_9BACT|nr:Uncharacterized protein dnm_055010 [Desulfonema magnum]
MISIIESVMSEFRGCFSREAAFSWFSVVKYPDKNFPVFLFESYSSGFREFYENSTRKYMSGQYRSARFLHTFVTN